MRSVLGTFYPTDYIIATFPSPDDADKAYHSLRRAGKSEDEVMILQSADALKFFIECRDGTGPFGSLMTKLSRGLGTESAYLDADIERAKSGSGFLVINSPTGADSGQVGQLLEQFAPVAIHLYGSGGIESMV